MCANDFLTPSPESLRVGDEVLAVALAAIRPELQYAMREDWLKPGDTGWPMNAKPLYRALSMLGMGENTVTDYMLNAGEEQLAFIVDFGLSGFRDLLSRFPPEFQEKARAMTEFWLCVGMKAAIHLSDRA